MRVTTAKVYFLPVETRVPLKFGPETLTHVTCARVRLEVERPSGLRAVGWGETPLSVQWVWPSSLSYETRHDVLKRFTLRLAEAWARPGSADGDEELIPGVEVRRTSGHSGGHQAIIVRGRDRTVAFIGDLCMRAWSANPKWITSFDDFPLTSVEVKAALFAEAAEEGWTIVLSHEPRRPVGRLVAYKDKFRFEPIL